MLDELGLVHMNGRILDPLTGRVLSVDFLVGDLQNGQGYNRYSYVENNPVNLSDPTGLSATPPPQPVIEPLPRVEVIGQRQNPCQDLFSCERFIQGLISVLQRFDRAWRIAEPIMAARMRQRVVQAAGAHAILVAGPEVEPLAAIASAVFIGKGIWDASNVFQRCRGRSGWRQ